MNEKKLLLDTASVSEIKRFFDRGSTAFAGVTTNPSLIAKEEKRPIDDLLVDIGKTINAGVYPHPHLSVEVYSLDPEEMLKQARQKVELFSENGVHSVDIFIKIPFLESTLGVITDLRYSGTRVNVTACMTAFQAKMAADAGASVVSFFYNRMIDGHREKYLPINKDDTWSAPLIGENHFRKWAQAEIGRFCKVSDVPVICGSIRQPWDVVECWEAGATYVTVSPKVARQMIVHPQTDRAVDQFQKEIESWLA